MQDLVASVCDVIRSQTNWTPLVSPSSTAAARNAKTNWKAEPAAPRNDAMMIKNTTLVKVSYVQLMFTFVRHVSASRDVDSATPGATFALMFRASRPLCTASRSPCEKSNIHTHKTKRPTDTNAEISGQFVSFSAFCLRSYFPVSRHAAVSHREQTGRLNCYKFSSWRQKSVRVVIYNHTVQPVCLCSWVTWTPP